MDTHPTAPPRPIPGSQFDWLYREIAAWQASDLISGDQAAAIRAGYRRVDGRRFSLGRLMLGLGGCFVGIGLIWLVAANLDELSPMLRFGVVALLWLLFLAGGEALDARGSSRPLVGSVRLIAALVFGAAVFQAAQSLQVPAYSPHLVGLWGAGALVHAYAVRAVSPLLVGVAAGTVWWVWLSLWDEPSAAAAVASIGAASVVAVSLAVVHDRGLHRFGFVWRSVGALLSLVALFAAAVPYATTDDFAWSPWLVGALVVAGVLAVAAVALSSGIARLEPVSAAAVLGMAAVLVAWDTGTDTSNIDAADWAHAGVSVAAYVLVAVGVAALGIVRDNPVLTLLAMLGLVVFTTFQSFAVFAAIIQGAWLFVVLGLVFLATGFLFDRARRGLADVLDTDSANPEGDAR
ncbi:DUF2157 domain-containing protein [Nocardioides gansuensis]|nr:DUF2157 domain-containing protein [Nocardioides gansuensis]